MPDPVIFDFDTDAEDWTTVGNGPSSYFAAGGNPSGYFGGSDGGSGVWYYRAPASMLGDREDFFGGTLSFDLIQADTSSPFVDQDVIFEGGGIILVATLPAPPATTWTSYTIDLEVGTFRFGSMTGRIATEAEIRTVLSQLVRVDIRGEYRSGADSSGIDNVVLAEGQVDVPDISTSSIVSTFDNSTDGWTFREDVSQFRHVATGGNPGGYLEVVDEVLGQVWFFLAPEAYLGDKSPFYDGQISFDLKQASTSSQFNDSDIILRSPSTVLVLDTAYNPGTNWTSYVIALNTSAPWRVNSITGALATEEQIRATLANLTSLEIRGEFRTGDDTGGLDNVILQTPAGVLAGTSNSETLIGTPDPDDIYGLAGNDVLDGGADADILRGGVGDDVYHVDNAGDQVIENAGEGVDEVRTGLASYVLGANIENLTGTSAAGQTLIGNALANVITGGAGGDVINGDAGDDTMRGGAGHDYYYVFQAGDTVVENAGEGTDTVLAYVSHTLAANVENLRLLAAGLTGTGNALANTIYGSSGDDTIIALGGADRIDAGAGNDTVDGGADADVIFGGAGNDTITGGAGLDYMVGQDGDDVYYADEAGDTVIEQPGGGTDTVYASSATHQLRPNIEFLIGTLASGQTLIGSSGAETIRGNVGNDVINGLAGNDAMEGGAGDDFYYVAQAGDTVLELAGEGTDTVLAYVNVTLGDNVENLRLLVGSLTGTGNALGNTMIGSAATDTLFGMGGADQINGGAGNDTIDAGEGNDFVWGGAGFDTIGGGDGNDVLRGEGDNDTLTGGAGADTLYGGAGNDVIRGGLDKDTLYGEAGADRFVFGEGETSAARPSADIVAGFSSAEGDKLDLRLIDANTTGTAPGDQAFAFIGNAAFGNVAGQLRYENSGGATWIEGDTNGDAIADFTIQLAGTLTPVATDFLL